MPLSLSERGRRLLDLLVGDDELSISEMSTALEVSPATIHNDLNQLSEKGFIVRIRGTAIPAFHPDLVARQKTRVEEKKRIARAAAELVEDGETIIIDSGTTAALMSRYLLGKREVHIVTNSMLILPDVRVNPGLKLTVVGGEFSAPIDCVVGKLALEGFSNFHVQKAFIGTTGFTIEDGITNMLLEGAEVVREMCKAAERTILLADSTKYGMLGFAKVLPLERFDQLITDSGLPGEALEAMREIGLKVTIA